jgi:hypothetical protein
LSIFFHDRPVYRDSWKKLKYFFHIYPNGSDQTKTTTMTMTTTTAQTAAPTTRRWKWSGETEEPDYNNRWNDDDDECTTTYKEHQQKLKDDAWNDYAHARDDEDDDAWFEDDECPSLLPAAVAAASAAQQQHVHTPFMNLTKEQRDEKSNQFMFGMCAHCDAGLDDESEFVCEPRGLDCWVIACNACHNYYQQLAYLRVVDDNCGCN